MDTPNNLYYVGQEVFMIMGEKHRYFGREFKRDAVQMVTEKGMAVGKVARELEIHPNLLHLWRRQFLAKGDKAFAGKGRIAPEKAEIRRLQKELERVKEERDILKKTLAFSKRQK
jgi:transposase